MGEAHRHDGLRATPCTQGSEDSQGPDGISSELQGLAPPAGESHAQGEDSHAQHEGERFEGLVVTQNQELMLEPKVMRRRERKKGK